MIKLIAVIDSVRGIVENPPEEVEAIFNSKIERNGALRLYNGYRGLDELHKLIDTAANIEAPVYVLGHATELEIVFPHAKELFIIQMNGVFKSSETFPAFEKTFYMAKRKPIQQVNGVQFQCQIWKPDLTNLKDSWDLDIRDDT